jgi:hypothetical protein
MDKEQMKPWSHQYQVTLNPMAANSISKFHGGISYTEFLKQIHQALKPVSYLEIGVGSGSTLAYAQCPAVAVDPNFQFQGNPIGRRAETHLFQLKSDEFFEKYDLKSFFPAGIGFAFLDGMHHFEYLLRDFMNTEKYSLKETVVALHDCYPVNTEIASRDLNLDRRTDVATRTWWAGDVWKLLPILRDYRPDLTVTTFNCPPTGLVVILGCDANSKILDNAYDEIVAKYRNMALDSYGIDRFRSEFPTSDSLRVMQPDAMRKYLLRAT